VFCAEFNVLAFGGARIIPISELHSVNKHSLVLKLLGDLLYPPSCR